MMIIHKSWKNKAHEKNPPKPLINSKVNLKNNYKANYKSLLHKVVQQQLNKVNKINNNSFCKKVS